MTNDWSKKFGLVNGQTYIIGRKGDICIDSPLVSKQHASIVIKNERIYLRDLNSTNGTFVIDNDILVDFQEGYVTPNQPIVLGDVECTIYGLLASPSVYSDIKNHSSQFKGTTQPIDSAVPHPEASAPDNKPIKK